MKHLITIGILLTLATACGRTDSTQSSPEDTTQTVHAYGVTDPNATRQAEVTRDSLTFLPHNFRYAPEPWDGCVCEFAENKEGYDHGTFLYANNLKDSAVFYLEGQEILLKIAPSGDAPNADAFSETAINDTYEVRLKGRKSRQIDYLEFYEGTILFKQLKDGQTYQTTFYGSCGC